MTRPKDLHQFTQGPVGESPPGNRDVVTKGWLRVAHRRIGESRSEPYRPVYAFDHAEPLRAGEIAPVILHMGGPSDSFLLTPSMPLNR